MSPRLRAIVDSLPDSERSFIQLTRLIPLAVAAAYLHMTPSALRAAIRRGALRAHMLDGRLHVGDSELERFWVGRATTAFPGAAPLGRAVPAIAIEDVDLAPDPAPVRELVAAGPRMLAGTGSR